VLVFSPGSCLSQIPRIVIDMKWGRGITFYCYCGFHHRPSIQDNCENQRLWLEKCIIKRVSGEWAGVNSPLPTPHSLSLVHSTKCLSGSFITGVNVKIWVRSILLALSFLVKKPEKGSVLTICLFLRKFFV